MRLLDYGKIVPGTIFGSTKLFGAAGSIIRATTAGLKNTFNPWIATHIFIAVQEHGLLYGIGMEFPRIRIVDLCDYENGILGEHLVFAAVPRELKENRELQEKANWWLLESHRRRVKYDLKELLLFWKITVRDDPEKLICSDLARNMLRFLNIPYPNDWNTKVDPYDHQKYFTNTSQLIKYWRHHEHNKAAVQLH